MKKITNAVLLSLLVLALAPVGASAAACHFSYEGADGPEHWWELCAPANLTCLSGTRQSPIDIPAAPAADLPDLGFQYHPAPLHVGNNGHTIQVDVEGGTSFLRLGQERYELVQFHFHTPSEHTLHGQSFPMELHFVHRNALGELAVVGVFLREGAFNPALQRIWDNIPGGGAELAAAHASGDFNPAALLPADQGYYRYAGSLTTPPCTEGVRWHVIEQPVDVSAAQIAQFRAIFPLNARPLQPRNQRTVLESQ